MRRTIRSARLAASLALVLAAAVVVPPAEASRPPHRVLVHRKARWIEMEVAGVAALDDDASSVVLLRQKNGGSVLPLFIGRSEGHAIDLRLHHGSAPRPLTYDLMEKAIAALGAKVIQIEITAVEGTVFTASVLLEQRGRRVALDARPSDSIALALGSEVPILVARRVLEDAGLSPNEVDQLRKRVQQEEPGSALTKRRTPLDL
jgi:bifunctional DNase/RNase